MAKRIKIKKIFTIILAVLLGIGVITAGVFIFRPKDTKRIYPNYHVGSIDSSGKHVESDDSIYSDLFNCQGLKIEPNFSSNVKFSVYFYRFDESFVNSVENQCEIYEFFDNDIIKYARIVITPNLNGESKAEHKIRFWQIFGIANSVKVMVNSKQVDIENLAEVEEEGSWDNSTDYTWLKLAPIDVSNIKTLAFVCESGVDNVFTSVKYKSSSSGTSTNLSLNSKIGTKMCLIDVSSYNEIYVSIKSDVQLKIYKYN